MNKTASQVVMHKDKRLLPIRLTVRKISGIGEDTQVNRDEVCQPYSSLRAPLERIDHTYINAQMI